MTMENIDSNDWNSEKEHVLKTDYPLHFACREGDVDQLRRLLDQYTATAVSSVDLTKAILCKEDSFYGWTPAHWAAYFGKLACLQKLACFNRPNNLKCDMRNSKFQQTPSHVAAYAGHPHCLQWLLQSEADINACDYLGETPLHKAASTGSLDCVSLLISYEATLGIKNSNGETACSVARRSGFQECARNLEMSNITSGIVTSATIPDTTMEVQPSVSLQEKTQTDILMDKDVKKNQKSVGGRKRTMEDLDEGIFKYLRQGDVRPALHPSEVLGSSMSLEVERNSHSLDHLNEVDRGILDSFKAVLSISTDPLNYDPETYPFLVNEPASNCTHTGIFQ